jgi:ribosomal protein L11 methyltransferase
VRQELTLELAAEFVPSAEAFLELAGAESIALRDAGDDPVLEPAPEATPLWPTVRLRAVFPTDSRLDDVCALLHSACAATSIQVAPLKDTDWQQAIRRAFEARPFGRRLWLAPADDTVVPERRCGIRLHMGLAFGTGEHPTTALCLDWLDAHVTEGATVLDYGCGSGVLAIAALALGASHGWATDNESQALTATRANAALNGVAKRLVVRAPDGLPAVRADIVAANILAGPLVELAPRLAAGARPGGAIVLSGILESQAKRVMSAYAPHCTDFASIVRHGWVCLAGVRRTGVNAAAKR